ncbi:PTS system mannitol-specific transporter subunit IIC [Salmonella enterica subsp. enterica serovar Typhimurium str. DT104]|nr:PTS system mannitol-specific transporter subunit IIC [Salmonella enterica subsp. enterica serovar Typhimurium str. DT104]
MAASIFRKILKENGIRNVEITNLAIADLTGAEEIIITIQSLEDRVKAKNSTAKIITLTQFLDKKSYENLAKKIKKIQEKEGFL